MAVNPALAGCAAARGGNMSIGEPSAFPVVDGRTCNMFQDRNLTLFVPIIEDDYVDVRAIAHGEDIDWVYIAEDGSIRMLLAGQGDPVIVKPDWPAPMVPGGQRSFSAFEAVWAGQTLHLIVRSSFTYPYPVPAMEDHWWHVWFDGQSHAELLPDPEPGRFRSGCVGGGCTVLVAHGDQVGFLTSDNLFTDVLQQTNEGLTRIWLGGPGPFDAPIERSGVMGMSLAIHNGNLFACALNATSYLFAESPDWRFEPLDAAPLGGQCYVAAADEPHVMTYGLPLIGGNGDGSGGSDDATEYRIWSRVDGVWVASDVPRTPWANVGFAASSKTPFFTDDSHDGSQDSELWRFDNGTWVRAWGKDGNFAAPIGGLSRPAVWGERLGPPWDYDGLAALRFDTL